MLYLELFPFLQEWIPVINADREAMEGAEPQKPFSDAYASSMPMKKRKVSVRGQDVMSLLGRGRM